MAEKNKEGTEKSSPDTLTDVIDQLEEKAGEDGELTVQDALDEFAGRVFGPLLVIPAMVVVTPLGAVPTIPTAMAVFIVLIASQALFGKKYPWLPNLITERSVEESQLKESMKKFRPWAKWIDAVLKPRLKWLVEGPMKYVIALVCLLMAAAIPPLELAPFACFIPGSAVLLLGLAMMAKDGLAGALGLVASVGALFVGGRWLI
ncbi:MAG: exopolysaccharide biosynthesis protein [Lacipirellulaceae bacterium]